MNVTIRQADEKDFLAIAQFTASCKPLEPYPAHLYKIMLRYCGNTAFLALAEGRIVGFQMGFLSQRRSGTYFLWQIGVSPSMQKQGIASRILRQAERCLRNSGVKRIEVTIDPENVPSQKLFERAGYTNVSRQEGKTATVEGNIAVKDYYAPGRHFMLYEKML